MFINGYIDSYIKGELIDCLDDKDDFNKRYKYKKPTIIYLVVNNSGDYEDNEDNIVAAFNDIESAIIYCDEYNLELNEFLKQQKKEHPDWYGFTFTNEAKVLKLSVESGGNKC